MPPKQTPKTRAKIAASVRHGRANKVPRSLRLDPDVDALFIRTVKARKITLAQAWESAVLTWCAIEVSPKPKKSK